MTRKRGQLLDLPPCPVCGVEYRDWRGYYPGGFRGPLSGHKRGAWEEHCERCEDYPEGAADFDPADFGPLDPDRALAAYVVSLDASEADAWGYVAPEAPTLPGPSYAVLGPFDVAPWI